MWTLIQYLLALVVVPACFMGAMYAFAVLMEAKAEEWYLQQVALSLFDRLLLVLSTYWLALGLALVGAWYLALIMWAKIRKGRGPAS